MTFECPAPIRALLDSLDVPLDELERHALVHCPEAPVLEVAETGADGREHRLAPEAAGAWRRMRDAAAADGVPLHLVSAFRSVERQAQIVRAKLDKGIPLDAILAVSAAPGFSEHHSGLAVDVGTPGSEPLAEAFEDTAASRWLAANAGRHGFRLSYPRGNSQGYAYEPWHWRYHGHMDTQTFDAVKFEAALKRDGYQEVETKTVAANFLSKPHTHEFDVHLLILEGQLTLTRDGKSDTYRAGDTFQMEAGCLHTEQYGPAATTYLVGRRRR